MPDKWERSEFVWGWPNGSRAERLTASVVRTRHDLWMNVKPQIMNAFSKIEDEGWVADGQLDESGLVWKSRKEIYIEPISVILMLFLVGFLLLARDLAKPRETEEIVEFRWPIKRRKA